MKQYLDQSQKIELGIEIDAFVDITHLIEEITKEHTLLMELEGGLWRVALDYLGEDDYYYQSTDKELVDALFACLKRIKG